MHRSKVSVNANGNGNGNGNGLVGGLEIQMGIVAEDGNDNIHNNDHHERKEMDDIDDDMIDEFMLDEKIGEKHVCNQCNKIFRSTSALMDHTISHENEKQFKCDLCLKPFSSSSLLQKHTKAVHSASSSYVCRVCYKKFNTMFNLKRHSRTHERRPTGNSNPGCHPYLMDHNGGILHPTLHQTGPKIAPLVEYRSNHNKSEPIPVELATEKT